VPDEPINPPPGFETDFPPDTDTDADREAPRGLTLALASLLGHVLGMVGCVAVGVWFVMEALDAPGATWARIAFGAAGAVLAGGGLGLGTSGIWRFVKWKQGGAYDRFVDAQARKLGLPTDPAAYQDGGLVVAATARNLDEAELIAIGLREAGIPAWVPDRLTVAWYWHYQYAINPAGVRVMVPMGRLADAAAVLAERQPASPPAETEPGPAEDDPAERLMAWSKRLLILLLISVTLTSPFVLPASIWVFAEAWKGWANTGRRAFKRVMGWSAVTGLIALVMLLVLAILFLPMLFDDSTWHLRPAPGRGYYLERDAVLP